MRTRITFRSVAVTGVLAIAVLSASCDKAQLLAPTNSTITVSASTRVLPIGGTTEITAFVVEQAGTPVQNGTTVRFITNLGTVNPVEAQTQNGVATTTFNAGDVSGVAEIRALSGNAGAGPGTSPPAGGSNGGAGGGAAPPAATAGNAVQITIGAAAVETVTVRTNPSTVSQNGGTVEVIASVLGAGGRAIPNVLVTFSANRGTLSATSAMSDANGEASVQLTTNADTTVNATAGGKSATTAAQITAQPGPSITLTCTSASSSNCSTVSVGDVAVFTVGRAANTSNIRSATLDFGDGTSVEVGNLSSNSTVSHQYTAGGNYTVRLTAIDVNNETTASTLVVIVQEPVTISLELSKTTERHIDATAIVLGCTPRVFDWNFGNNAVNQTRTTTENSASSDYTAGGTKVITVTVRCTDGRTANTSGQLTLDTNP